MGGLYSCFCCKRLYKNRTAFKEEHMVMTWVNGKYPKVDQIFRVGRLIRLRNRILVDMDFKRETCSHHEDVYVNYDVAKYKENKSSFAGTHIKRADCQRRRTLLCMTTHRK